MSAWLVRTADRSARESSERHESASRRPLKLGRNVMALPNGPTSTLTYSGKVALVTGAGSGIGLATAQFLADTGMTVYGLDLKFHESGTFEQIEVDVCDTDKIREKLENLPGT